MSHNPVDSSTTSLLAEALVGSCSVALASADLNRPGFRGEFDRRFMLRLDRR